MYPEIGVAWEKEFLRLIDSLELNRTIANPLISHSLELEMVEVRDTEYNRYKIIESNSVITNKTISKPLLLRPKSM